MPCIVTKLVKINFLLLWKKDSTTLREVLPESYSNSNKSMPIPCTYYYSDIHFKRPTHSVRFSLAFSNMPYKFITASRMLHVFASHHRYVIKNYRTKKTYACAKYMR